MTTRVDPSVTSDGFAVSIAAALRAGNREYIVPGDQSEAAHLHPEMDSTATPYNAAASSHSGSSLTVTIDTFEAFVGGRWLARDVTTDYNLDASTAGQTLYLGVDVDTSDGVIIGKAGDFAADDPKIPIHTYDTDSNGVTAHTDERTIGQTDSTDYLQADQADLGRTLFDEVAAGQQAKGTGKGETWRAAGSSDLLMSLNVDGKAWLTYNAYYNESANEWRYIVGGERAHAFAFGDSNHQNTSFLIGDVANPNADDPVNWVGYGVDENGSLYSQAGNTVFDYVNGWVPQSNLEGPASDLQTYPLDSTDIVDGSNNSNGVDAYTLQGNTPGDLQSSGQWTQIATVTDTDETTELVKHTFAPTTTYDVYRIEILHENRGNEKSWTSVRLNGDTSKSYYYKSIDDSNNLVNANAAMFQHIGGVYPGEFSVHTYDIFCPSPVGSSLSNHYPVIKESDRAVNHDMTSVAIYGELRNSYSVVDQITVEGRVDPGTGQYRLFGRNIT